jgi:hypothetical protein
MNTQVIDEVITDPTNPAYFSQENMDRRFSKMMEEQKIIDSINERADKAKELVDACFWPRSHSEKLKELISDLRVNCFDHPSLNNPDARERYPDHHIKASQTLDWIIASCKTMLAQGDFEDVGQDYDIIKKRIEVQLYRERRIRRRMQRPATPLSMMTSGTRIKFELSGDGLQEGTVMNVIQNGIDSYCVELMEIVEDRCSNEHPGPGVHKTFNHSFVTAVIQNKPGHLKIDDSWQRNCQLFRRDVPKKRFNAKVKKIKAKKHHELGDARWRYHPLPNYNSEMTVNGPFVRRNGKYRMDRGNDFIADLVSKFEPTHERVAVDIKSLMFYLHDRGVLRLVQDDRFWESVFVTDRRRLEKAIKQNLNRFKMSMDHRRMLARQHDDEMNRMMEADMDF